jgi:hypothetical protein
VLCILCPFREKFATGIMSGGFRNQHFNIRTPGFWRECASRNMAKCRVRTDLVYETRVQHRS